MSMRSWRQSTGTMRSSSMTALVAKDDGGGPPGAVRRAQVRLEVESAAHGVDARLGAGFIRVAAGRSGDPERAGRRPARFAREPASDDDGAGQIANPRLHHAGLADGVEFGCAGAEGDGSPRFAGRG